MTTHVEADSIREADRAIEYVRAASLGGAVVLQADGKDVAVLIPAGAYRAVREMIELALRFPVMCWDAKVLVPGRTTTGRAD